MLKIVAVKWWMFLLFILLKKKKKVVNQVFYAKTVSFELDKSYLKL